MSLPQLLHSGTADIDVKLFQSPGFHTVLVKLVTERFSPDLQLIVEVFVICLLIIFTLAPVFVNLSINTLLEQHLISQLSDFFSSFSPLEHPLTSFLMSSRSVLITPALLQQPRNRFLSV